MKDFLVQADSEWHDLLAESLSKMDKSYLKSLQQTENNWLPGLANIFRAFSMPLSQASYILLGESPYPRSQSANGMAFWDANVEKIWSETGLTKPVNKATSLRNLIKMLLHARGDLTDDFSQNAIATLSTSGYVQTLPELFQKILDKGFILLNASLVYQKNQVNYHARHWQPFMDHLFAELLVIKPDLKLVLFGKVAKKVKLIDQFSGLVAEHPYNNSFIINEDVLNFFKPLDLLNKYD